MFSCDKVWINSRDRINALFKVLLSRLLLLWICETLESSSQRTSTRCTSARPRKLAVYNLSNSSLGKQPKFQDATTGCPSKWRSRNELRNSILMTRHYLDLFGWKFASTKQKHYSHLRSFLRCHFVGKTVVASRNFGCFLRPFKLLTKQRSIMNEQNRQNAKPRKWNVTHRFSLHVTYQVLFSAICLGVLNLNSTRGRSRKIVLLLIFKLPAEKHVYLENLSDMHMAEQMTQSLDKTW